MPTPQGRGVPGRGLSPLTVAHVQEGHEDGQQPSHGHLAHELAIAVVGAQGERPLAQVGQTLVGQRKRVRKWWGNARDPG